MPAPLPARKPPTGYGPSCLVLSDFSAGHPSRKHRRPGAVRLGSTPTPTGLKTRAMRLGGPRHPASTAAAWRGEGRLSRRWRGHTGAAAAGGRPVAPHRSLRLTADAGQTRQQSVPSSDHSLFFSVHVNFVLSRVGLSSAECNGVLGARRAQRCKTPVTRAGSPRQWRVCPPSRRAHPGVRRPARSPPPCSVLEVGLWWEYACRGRTSPPPRGWPTLACTPSIRLRPLDWFPSPVRSPASRVDGPLSRTSAHGGRFFCPFCACRRPEHVAQQCAVYSSCCPHGRRPPGSVRLIPPRVGRACTKTGV